MKTGRPKFWTDENIERAKRLWHTHTAREVGRMFDRSKNSVLGALYRDKVKNGYTPPPDSKYTARKYNYPSRRYWLIVIPMLIGDIRKD